jgi:DNA-binding Lrp family transcriptional regulator
LKALTEKQQRCWDLQQAGKSVLEISRELGISESVVNKRLCIARRKLGITHQTNAGVTEVKDPEKFGAILDAVSETKLTKLSDALRENGIPPGACASIIHRIRVKYFGAVTEVRNLKKMELDEMLGRKIHLMLHYIDDKVASEASARDLAMGVAQLIEKQQLIRGEPTQIVSDLERKKLNELLPLAIAEVKRRNLTIEGRVLERTIEHSGP